MEVKLLSGFWMVTSAVLIISYFIDQHPSAPNVWRSLFRWGKMRVGFVVGTNHFYEVPKRWFRHFYIVGILMNSYVLYLVYHKAFLDGEWPEFFSYFVELLQHPAGHTGVTNAVPVLLALTLELIQVMRRSYETFFINVFSRGATMTLLHYVLGFVFYLSISLCVLAGTRFQHLHMPDAISLKDEIAYTVAVVIFLSASLVQHHSFRILAALRNNGKDQASKKTKSTYLLPRGGLFEVVSCPHFMAEIVVYFSLCVVFQFQNFAVISLFLFVFVNQVLAALLNHQWYCQHFPGIGRYRCAIFPHLL